MTKIIAIAGSLRAASFNASLLRAAAPLMPAGSVLEIGTIRDIPLYDGDLEAASGIPASVTLLKEQIATADGLLIASPEYNNAMPGVLKNAIDWLSRTPDSARAFSNKPVAIVGASPGGFGTILAQNSWLPVMRTLGTRQWFGGRLMVSRAGSVFDANGELVDEKIRAQLQEFLQGFVAFTEG